MNLPNTEPPPGSKAWYAWHGFSFHKCSDYHTQLRYGAAKLADIWPQAGKIRVLWPAARKGQCPQLDMTAIRAIALKVARRFTHESPAYRKPKRQATATKPSQPTVTLPSREIQKKLPLNFPMTPVEEEEVVVYTRRYTPVDFEMDGDELRLFITTTSYAESLRLSKTNTEQLLAKAAAAYAELLRTRCPDTVPGPVESQ